MSDRPIIFSAPMIRALLAGRKTQTRRLLKPQPLAGQSAHLYPTAKVDWQLRNKMGCVISSERLRYAPGDRLWVREAWCPNALTCGQTVHYRADGYHVVVDDGDEFAVINKDGTERSPWRPSIHMPRWASRLTLTVTDVRVQRLQEISEEDAMAEGVEPVLGPSGGSNTPHVEGFRNLWNATHGSYAWATNPWVAAISFSVERRNIDAETADERKQE